MGAAATYLFAYYVVGMGMGIPLALKTSLGIVGQWIGITSASAFCTVALGLYYTCLPWPTLVQEAQDRMAEEPTHEELPLSSLGEEDADGDLELQDLAGSRVSP